MPYGAEAGNTPLRRGDRQHGGRAGLPADLIAPDGRVPAAGCGVHADDRRPVGKLPALPERAGVLRPNG